MGEESSTRANDYWASWDWRKVQEALVGDVAEDGYTHVNEIREGQPGALESVCRDINDAAATLESSVKPPLEWARQQLIDDAAWVGDAADAFKGVLGQFQRTVAADTRLMWADDGLYFLLWDVSNVHREAVNNMIALNEDGAERTRRRYEELVAVWKNDYAKYGSMLPLSPPHKPWFINGKGEAIYTPSSYSDIDEEMSRQAREILAKTANAFLLANGRIKARMLPTSILPDTSVPEDPLSKLGPPPSSSDSANNLEGPSVEAPPDPPSPDTVKSPEDSSAKAPPDLTSADIANAPSAVKAVDPPPVATAPGPGLAGEAPGLSTGSPGLVPTGAGPVSAADFGDLSSPAVSFASGVSPSAGGWGDSLGVGAPAVDGAPFGVDGARFGVDGAPFLAGSLSAGTLSSADRRAGVSGVAVPGLDGGLFSPEFLSPDIPIPGSLPQGALSRNDGPGSLLGPVPSLPLAGAPGMASDFPYAGGSPEGLVARAPGMASDFPYAGGSPEGLVARAPGMASDFPYAGGSPSAPSLAQSHGFGGVVAVPPGGNAPPMGSGGLLDSPAVGGAPGTFGGPGSGNPASRDGDGLLSGLGAMDPAASALYGGSASGGGVGAGGGGGLPGVPGSGMPFLPMSPMGGVPADRGEKERERERTTWLLEDRDVWNVAGEVGPGIVQGADPREVAEVSHQQAPAPAPLRRAATALQQQQSQTGTA